MNTLYARSCKAIVVTLFFLLSGLSSEIAAQDKAPEPAKPEKNGTKPFN
ncbi:MAG: hypothetical protein IPJ54_15995 [Saprospiraceae bacterium]|nr:hypothetical protein [Saprospiraceae bacterium]